MGREIEFKDTFEGTELDRTRWVPYYLPHWSSHGEALRFLLRLSPNCVIPEIVFQRPDEAI